MRSSMKIMPQYYTTPMPVSRHQLPAPHVNELATLCRTICRTLYAHDHYQAGQIGHSAISDGLSNQLAQLAGVIDRPIIDGRLGSLLIRYSRDGRNNAATIP